jgi:hypothetical protein
MGLDAREMRADWVGTWDFGLGGGKDAANIATGIIRTVYVWILAGHSVITQCNSLLSCTVNSKILLRSTIYLFTAWLLVCGEVWTCGVVSVSGSGSHKLAAARVPACRLAAAYPLSQLMVIQHRPDLCRPSTEDALLT